MSTSRLRLRPPATRALVACVIGTTLLLGCHAVIAAVDATRRIATPLGPVSVPELAAVALSMLVAGAIAGERFRALAVALVAISGAAGMLVAAMLAPGSATAAVTWIVREGVFELALEASCAWLAATAGDRAVRALAARRAVAAGL